MSFVENGDHHISSRECRRRRTATQLIAITDVPLENCVPSVRADGRQIVVDNFSFSPAAAMVPAGTTITWTNRDDVPLVRHLVQYAIC